METPKTVLIELRPSKIHAGGVGVFTIMFISAGEMVAEGIHNADLKDIICWSRFGKYSKEIQRKIMDFCVGTPKGFIPPENMNFNRLTVEWYFNHSCAGNLGFNKSGDFVALRNIKSGEELSYDYSLADSNPNFNMKCLCNSKVCRKVITGNDWKDQCFQKNNFKHMLPYIQRQIDNGCKSFASLEDFA